MTVDPDATPLQQSEQLRTSRLADLRRIVEILEASPQLDPIRPVQVTIRQFGDTYNDPGWSMLYSLPDILKRARALTFLARHLRGLKRHAKVRKEVTDHSYELVIDVGEHSIRVVKDSEQVCRLEPELDPVSGEQVIEAVEVVDYGADEVMQLIRAKPKKIEHRPVFNKICPPSILAGIDDEIG